MPADVAALIGVDELAPTQRLALYVGEVDLVIRRGRLNHSARWTQGGGHFLSDRYGPGKLSGYAVALPGAAGNSFGGTPRGKTGARSPELRSPRGY